MPRGAVDHPFDHGECEEAEVVVVVGDSSREASSGD